MDETSKALLLLNGVPHRLSAVLANARQAPVVSIAVTEINPLPHCGGPADSLVEHRPATPEATEREIVFFKQQGGYTVLLGRKKFDEMLTKPVTEAQAKAKAQTSMVIQGRLLSTPMLKKCRLDNEQEAQSLQADYQRDTRTSFQDRSYQGNRIDLPRRSNQWGRE